MGLANQSKPVRTGRQQPLVAVLSLFGLLLAGLVIPKVLGQIQLLVTTLVSSLTALAIALVGLFSRGDSKTEKSVQFIKNSTLSMRALSLVLLGVYWTYTREISRDDGLLFLLQIPFAYLIAMGMQWRRRTLYRFDLMPLVIVLTLSFFIWFKDQWWALQLVMLALAVSAQTVLTLQTQRAVARFNVLGLVLAILSGVLIFGPGIDVVRDATLGRSDGDKELILVALLLIGFLTYRVRPVLPTAIGALGGTLLVDACWRLGSGAGFFLDTPIPISIVLTILILVPDERSGPMTRSGQLGFGLLFGVLSCCAYEALWTYGGLPWGQQLTYFSCFLPFPILGLIVPALEKTAREQPIDPVHRGGGSGPITVLSIAALVALFVIIRFPLNIEPIAHLETLEDACKSDDASCGRFVAKWNEICRVPNSRSRPDECEKNAVEIHQSGCEYGLQDECAALGFNVLKKANSNEKTRGDDLILTACKSGLTSVCNRRAADLAKQQPSQIKLRRQLSRIACDRADREGCEQLGMVMYETAKTPKQFKQASEKLYFACQAQRSLACYTLAEMLLIGQFGKTSPSRARILFDSACRRGYSKACIRLQQLQKNEPSRKPSKARTQPPTPSPQ
ncbi:MAG: hypothetical protein VYA30_01025 [Myxococcota bacterium]|nr:hypothetical protein [Myxococcota bacterium]